MSKTCSRSITTNPKSTGIMSKHDLDEQRQIYREGYQQIPSTGMRQTGDQHARKENGHAQPGQKEKEMQDCNRWSISWRLGMHCLFSSCSNCKEIQVRATQASEGPAQWLHASLYMKRVDERPLLSPDLGTPPPPSTQRPPLLREQIPLRNPSKVRTCLEFSCLSLFLFISWLDLPEFRLLVYSGGRSVLFRACDSISDRYVVLVIGFCFDSV